MTSKNSNYAAAESYLTFQHNEYTGLPILDEKGRPKLRDSYLLDTLECGESSFAMACLIANRKYGKNGGREDVKTHHYIVSFDPKDAVENGLTMEKAQALGLQFCKPRACARSMVRSFSTASFGSKLMNILRMAGGACCARIY